MSNIITKIKSSKIVNTGILKKIKDKIYYSYISPREEKKTDKYRTEILDKFSKICEGQRWILSSGAFLKYYRDAIMDGQDLDFNILDEDFEKIKNKFFDYGFKVKQLFLDNKGRITEYKYLYENVEVDVLIIKKEKGKNKYSNSFTFEKKNAKEIKKTVIGNKQIIEGKDYISYKRMITDFDKIKQYNYKNIEFNGPKDAEQHLVELYGKNWNIYDPNYDPRTSPENNVPISSENAKSIVYIKPISYYEENFDKV